MGMAKFPDSFWIETHDREDVVAWDLVDREDVVSWE